MEVLYNFGLRQIIRIFTKSPTLGLNYLLQSVFFGLSMSSFTVLLLRAVRFSYAKAVVDNKVAKLIIILLFMYSKVWDQWSTWFMGLGCGCAIFMCLYTFDSCLNIAEYYSQNVRGLYWGQVVSYSVFTMIVPLALIRFLDPQYPPILFITLLAEIILIAVMNALKNKHIIFSAVPSLVMVSTSLIRVFCQSSYYTQQLPLQTIPMIMMAFDAEYRQNTTKLADRSSNL